MKMNIDNLKKLLSMVKNLGSLVFGKSNSAFCDLFPYDNYDEQHSLFLNDEGVGFVIEVPPLLGASEEIQKELSNLFINFLPEESGIQFMLWADPNIDPKCNQYYQECIDQGDIYTHLAKQRIDYLKSLVPGSNLNPYTLRNFRCVISFNMTTQINNSILTDVEGILGQVKTTLERVGFNVKVWQPEDLINTLHGILHFDMKKEKAPVTGFNKFQRLSDQLKFLDSNVQERQNSVLLNDGKIEARVLKVDQYPDDSELQAMNFLIGDEERVFTQIPCPFILHYGVYIPKQEKPKSKVMAKEAYVLRQTDSTIGEYIKSVQQEASEINYISGQLEKDRRIVHRQFNIVLLSTPDCIAKAEQIAQIYYASRGWSVKTTFYLSLPSFLMCMPMMWTQDRVDDGLKLKMIKTTWSTKSGNLLPLQGEWHSTITPGVLLAGRRGQIFNWNPFDNKKGNYDVVIIGSAGSGKSYHMKERLTSTLRLGGRVFILDLEGGTYEKICSAFSGQFIQVSPMSNLCLNPFSNLLTDGDDTELESLYMVKSILKLMAFPRRETSAFEDALLEQAIMTIWREKRDESNITDVANYLLSQENISSKNIGTLLYPYTIKGNYGRFFNEKSNVNLDNNLVVVEFSNLDSTPDLKSVMRLSMVLKIKEELHRSNQKHSNLVILDGAFDLLKNPNESIAFHLMTLSFRKNNAGIIIGTHMIDDFFINQGAQYIFNNCEWKCFFNQDHHVVSKLKKNNMMILTPHQESLLISLKRFNGKYSEMMIVGPDGCAVGRSILDPCSAFLYSINGEEYPAVKDLMDKGMSAPDAINYLMELKKTA